MTVEIQNQNITKIQAKSLNTEQKDNKKKSGLLALRILLWLSMIIKRNVA